MKIFNKGYIWFIIGLMMPIAGACILTYYLYINNLININM